MNIAGYYITHHNAALGTKIRLTLLRADWHVRCSTGSVALRHAGRRRQLICVGEGVYSDATQVDVKLSCVAINGP